MKVSTTYQIFMAYMRLYRKYCAVPTIDGLAEYAKKYIASMPNGKSPSKLGRKFYGN